MGAGYKHHLDSIPPKLLSIIKKAKWEEVVLGCSGTKVFHLTGIHNKQNAYLKIHKGLIKNLYNEKKCLTG
jgi:aminoglycoside phosphotransferase